jgi:ParB family chromosome partitioning protein
LGEQNGENYKQIQRYIRLTNLIPELLKMVDEKHIAFNPAVELSYLPEEAQKKLLEIMDMQQSTPTLSQAQQMKQLSSEGKLNEEAMLQFLSGEKPNQKEKVSIKRERIEQYFPKDYSAKQMEDTIVKLLDDWQRKRQREREPSR